MCPKFWAIIGDGCRLAYGVLLGPGAIIGRRCVLYPDMVLSERHIPDDVVVKADRTGVLIKRRGAESNLPEGVGRRSQMDRGGINRGSGLGRMAGS